MRHTLLAIVALVIAGFSFFAPATSAQAACGSKNTDITVGCNRKINVTATEDSFVRGGKAFLQQSGQPKGCLLAMKARRTTANDKMFGKPITTTWFVLAASGVERKGGKWADITKGGLSGIKGYEKFPGACDRSSYVEIQQL